MFSKRGESSGIIGRASLCAEPTTFGNVYLYNPCVINKLKLTHVLDIGYTIIP